MSDLLLIATVGQAVGQLLGQPQLRIDGQESDGTAVGAGIYHASREFFRLAGSSIPVLRQACPERVEGLTMV
ncbi:MAG: hypothetical protein CV081_08760 [Nitrospira sp. LK265]|nr:hypothetical protein [Nitrospira sp.]NGZ60576.1 hypothetical protein [Nitrospira sp. LK265]